MITIDQATANLDAARSRWARVVVRADHLSPLTSIWLRRVVGRLHELESRIPTRRGDEQLGAIVDAAVAYDSSARVGVTGAPPFGMGCE